MASDQYIKDIEEANRLALQSLKEQQDLALKNIREESARQQEALNASRVSARKRMLENTRAAYLQNMKSRRELPELLYQQGYSGGLTESALIGLENRYGRAYSDAMSDYSQENSAIDAQRMGILGNEASLIAESELGYAKKYADLVYDYRMARAKALEEQRAAALKAAAKTSYSSAKSSKKDDDEKKSANDTSAAKAAGKKARVTKGVYYSLN